jgi:hypothetical protein
MRVEQITNDRGRAVANQFQITGDDGARYFQSYKSIIVKIHNGITWLDSHYWDYSKTTSRWRNYFLGEDTKTIKAKIKSGEYRLADLNT